MFRLRRSSNGKFWHATRVGREAERMMLTALTVCQKSRHSSKVFCIRPPICQHRCLHLMALTFPTATLGCQTAMVTLVQPTTCKPLIILSGSLIKVETH